MTEEQSKRIIDQSNEALKKVHDMGIKLKQMENFLFLDNADLEDLYNKNKERLDNEKEDSTGN